MPYNTRTRKYTCTSPYGGLYQTIRRGAFTADALDGARTMTRLLVNHERWQEVEDKTLALIHGRSGLYVLAHLQDGSVTRAIMAERSRWTGLSSGLNFADEEWFVDHQTSTQVVTKITGVNEISVCIVDSYPLYPTWLIDATDDLSEAIDRIKSAEHAACVADFGADYKTTMPRYCWTLPRQGPRSEARRCAVDPGRAMDLALMSQLGR